MLLAAAGFALGIIDAHWVWHPPLLSLLGAFLAAGLAFLAARTAVRTLWLPLLLLWFSAGQFCAFVAPIPQTSPALLQLADGLQRNVSGTVTAIHSERTETRLSPYGRPAETEQTQQIDLSLDHVEDFNADYDWQTAVVGGLRLNVYAKSGESLPQLRCGERLNVQLRFHRPEYFLDPGAWNYPAYLAQRGIAVLGSVDATALHVESTRDRPTLSCLATAAQTWAGTRLDRIATISASYSWLPQWMRLTPQDSSVLSAMLFGDRTRLQHSMRSAFERTGSFHLLVVSGLHITIVIGLIFWLARKLRLGQVPATLMAILLALPYAFLTGFAPPVQRALWLSAVYLLSRILYRERAALNAIGIASIGVLIHNPSALFDASFQMTFLAVLVIAGVAMPLIEATLAPYLRGVRLPRQIRLDPFLPPKVTQMRVLLRMYVERLRYIVGPRWGWRLPFGFVRWCLRFTEAMIVALVVELAMVLPMAVYFHRITLVALPANLFGLPLLAFMLPLALFTFLLGCIHPALAVPSGALTAIIAACNLLVDPFVREFRRFLAANSQSTDVVFFLFRRGMDRGLMDGPTVAKMEDHSVDGDFRGLSAGAVAGSDHAASWCDGGDGNRCGAGRFSADCYAGWAHAAGGCRGSGRRAAHRRFSIRYWRGGGVAIFMDTPYSPAGRGCADPCAQRPHGWYAGHPAEFPSQSLVGGQQSPDSGLLNHCWRWLRKRKFQSNG